MNTNKNCEWLMKDTKCFWRRVGNGSTIKLGECTYLKDTTICQYRNNITHTEDNEVLCIENNITSAYKCLYAHDINDDYVMCSIDEGSCSCYLVNDKVCSKLKKE